jgi:hypothetical protein
MHRLARTLSDVNAKAKALRPARKTAVVGAPSGSPSEQTLPGSGGRVTSHPVEKSKISSRCSHCQYGYFENNGVRATNVAFFAFALAAGPEVAMTVHPVQVVACSGHDR